MMVATSSKKIQEAKKMITSFRHYLTEYLEEGEEKDSVYQLSLSLFPLVDSHDEKEER